MACQDSDVAQGLANAYAKHADMLWQQRIVDIPKESPLSPRAVLFLSMMPVNALKERLADLPESRCLRVILRILFEHEPGPPLQLAEDFGGPGYTLWVEELRRFDAEDVLQACARLWTVELEAPAQNGAYFWTYRAEYAEAGRADNVIEISISRRGRPHRIVHFHVYRMTTFDNSRFGPLITWRNTERRGRGWRTDSPNALKYLSGGKVDGGR